MHALQAFLMKGLSISVLASVLILPESILAQEVTVYDTDWRVKESIRPKLVQSYALDGLDWPGEEKEDRVPAASVRRFLEGVRRASEKTYPSLGLGRNVRVDRPFVSGAAMVHDGKVLHLSAFSHPGQGERGTKVPFRRFSQRRKRG